LTIATADNNIEALDAALNDAERFDEVSASALQAGHDRLTALQHRGVAKDRLLAAISEVDRADLILKLDVARDLGVDAPTLQQGDDRVLELQDMMDAAVVDLRAAMLTRNSEHLLETLHEATRLSAADEELQDTAAERLAHLTIADHAEIVLTQAMRGVDLALVQSTLADARAQDADPEVLQAGEHRIVEIQDMMDAVIGVLADAVEGRDLLVLTVAMAEAVRLQAVPQDVMQEAQARLEVLQEISDATKALVAAGPTDDMHAIVMALAHARTVGVDREVIEEGEREAQRVRVLLQHVRQRMIDLTASGTDADELQAALDETNRVRAASPRRIHEAEEKIAQLRR